MLRIQQKLILFSITSHKIAYNVKDCIKDPVLNFYPVVGLKDTKLGSIVLNQPNNQNFLTIEMMDELFRFLNTYHHDHTVQNVWIQNRGSMFLGGISYQQLFKNPDYLDKLYKMTVMAAKLNKPVFSCITGGVRNVGAYILSMAAVALTDYSASLRIDQVSKGFIPVAGGSHRLSRLPANIGFYLALTGKRISSDEMSRLGLITGVVKQGVSSKQIRANITKSNLFFREKISVNRYDKRQSQWNQWTTILEKQQRLNSQLQINQFDILRSQQNVFAKFAMNQYKLDQINYQNAKKPFNSFSEKPQRFINNYYNLRHEKAWKYIQKQGLVQKSHFQDVRLPGFQIDKILKVFQQDNLSAAIKILEADQSDWGKQTLKNLRKMDPLAAILTFELLKRAQNLSWDQCLEVQYTVSKRLLAQSKLELKQTYSGSKFCLVNKYSQTKIQQIPHENVIDEFFGPAVTEEQKLQSQVPLNSLLPTSDYRHIPDAARLAMNRIFFDDIHIQNQQKEMKRWLQNEKIDYRHKSYNIHSLRQKIYNKNQYEFIKSNQSKRLQYLTNNSRVLRNYIQQKYDFVDKMGNQELSKILSQTIKSVFNNGINSRFEEFSKTASIIGKQKKLQIFKNLRKTLVKKIVINGAEIQQVNVARNQSYKGPVFFDRQTQNLFEKKNPYFEQSETLDKLAEEIATKGELSEQFLQNEGALPVQKNVALGENQKEQTKRQLYLNKVKHNIAKRYNQYPSAWDRAYQYRELITNASRTSEQLSDYIQLDSNGIYATILNSPAAPKTYGQLGQQSLDRIKTQRQRQKQDMRLQIEFNNTFVNQYFENSYASQETTHKPYTFIRDRLIPDNIITRELEKFAAPLFDQVLKHFEDKYFNEAVKQKKLQFGQFDKFVYELQDQQFISTYKNDILFVYSYFAILKMKEVLFALKQNGIPQKQQKIHQFFKQFNIQLNQDRPIQFINKLLSKFLFNMLDIHTYTKPKIRLPQSKLLDFLNRTKINFQTNAKSSYPLSFQSLLLMIGKDRSRIYNKVLKEYLPTEPQYLLDMVNNNTKDQLNNTNAVKQHHTADLYVAENAVSSEHLNRKQLIPGFQYYLGLFDSFIHRAAGKYNFVNQETLSLDPKKLKAQFSNIINLKQTNEEWFQRVSADAIKNFFNVRIELQKNLTKGQLLALDQDLKQVFNPQTFRLMIKYHVQSQIEQTKVLFKSTRHYSYQTNDSDINQERYCQIRRRVKNPEAFKRLNNLRMAMTVKHDYYMDSKKRVITSELQKEDLVEEKKEFHQYQRFPRQTYNRIVDQSFSYGEEKSFDQYLNPLKDRQMNQKKASKNLKFAEDQRKTKTKKQEKLTNFEDEIKSLRQTILNNSNNEEVDSIYKKIEEIL